MNQTTFTFKTFTEAMRARRALSAADITVSLFKLSAPTENGCAYAVSLPSELHLSAVRALRENGIDYRLYAP